MHIDHSVRGEGEPLLLIHGLFGTRENLGALARLLSEHYKVYSIDLPNHGKSVHLDHADLAVLAESVDRWMDQVGLASALVLGHSLGGKAAMELALSQPERVKKLVVADIAPVQYGHRHTDVFAGLMGVDLDVLASRVDAEQVLAEHIEEKPVRSFLLKNLQKRQDGKYQWRMNLQGLYDCYPSLVKANRIGTWQGETLFLKAENSDYILAEHRDEILSRFPKTELKIVSGTGHWLHAEKPELIARMVNRFFQA